jgi:PBP1b-binding outer membrane lipoprotein LpoB
MRTRATITLAAALLFALTACSSDSDDKPSTAESRPATSEQQEPSTVPTPADTAGLESAVREYTDAYFKGDVNTAYGMLSGRCTEKINKPAMQALTDRAVGDYGHQDVKRFEVDQVSGDMARVSYGVGLPKFDQKQQPWVREGGDWKYDAC